MSQAALLRGCAAAIAADARPRLTDEGCSELCKLLVERRLLGEAHLQGASSSARSAVAQAVEQWHSSLLAVFKECVSSSAVVCWGHIRTMPAPVTFTARIGQPSRALLAVLCLQDPSTAQFTRLLAATVVSCDGARFVLGYQTALGALLDALKTQRDMLVFSAGTAAPPPPTKKRALGGAPQEGTAATSQAMVATLCVTCCSITQLVGR